MPFLEKPGWYKLVPVLVLSWCGHTANTTSELTWPGLQMEISGGLPMDGSQKGCKQPHLSSRVCIINMSFFYRCHGTDARKCHFYPCSGSSPRTVPHPSMVFYGSDVSQKSIASKKLRDLLCSLNMKGSLQLTFLNAQHCTICQLIYSPKAT